MLEGMTKEKNGVLFQSKFPKHSLIRLPRYDRKDLQEHPELSGQMNGHTIVFGGTKNTYDPKADPRIKDNPEEVAATFEFLKNHPAFGKDFFIYRPEEEPMPQMTRGQYADAIDKEVEKRLQKLNTKGEK